MKEWQRWLSVAAISVAIAGCAGDEKDEASGPEFKSAEEGYNMAMDAMQGREYKTAILHFEDIERVFPYSPWATRATLMTAYANYKIGEYDIAQAVLERFVRLHPGNELAPYAYYLLAMCSYEQITDVGRDQKITEQAQSALTEVVKRFPETSYARDAKLKLDLVEDHLAGKEMTIGRYYQTRQDHLAAINRFKYVITNFQTTSHVSEALHRLVEANLALGLRDEAQRNAAVLGKNFPASEWYRRSFALMQELPPAQKKSLPIPTIPEKKQAEPVPVPPVSGSDLDLPVLNNTKGGALPPLGVKEEPKVEEKKEEAKPEEKKEEEKKESSSGETWIERQWKKLPEIGIGEESKPEAPKPVVAPKPVEAPAAVIAPEPQPVPVPAPAVETPPAPVALPVERKKEAKPVEKKPAVVAPDPVLEPAPVPVPAPVESKPEPKPVESKPEPAPVAVPAEPVPVPAPAPKLEEKKPVETKAPEKPAAPVAVPAEKPAEPQPAPVEKKAEEAKPVEPAKAPTLQDVPPAERSWIDQQWDKLPPLETERPAGSMPRDFISEEPVGEPKEKPAEVKPAEAPAATAPAPSAVPAEKKEVPAQPAGQESWFERQWNNLPSLGLIGDGDSDVSAPLQGPSGTPPSVEKSSDALPALPTHAPSESKPEEKPVEAPAVTAPAPVVVPVEAKPEATKPVETPKAVETPAAVTAPEPPSVPVPAVEAPAVPVEHKEEAKPVEAPVAAPVPPVDVPALDTPAVPLGEPPVLEGAKPVESWESKPAEKKEEPKPAGSWLERQWKKVTE